MSYLTKIVLLVTFLIASSTTFALSCTGTYFPPRGQTLKFQKMKLPSEVGLHESIIQDLQATIKAGRWAIWRHGYLVHVQGKFNANVDIRSGWKTFHAGVVGGLINLGKIDSLDQLLADWNAQVPGGPNNCHLNATIRHALTQTTAFDEPQMCPGDIWAFSNANPPVITNVAVRAWQGANTSDPISDYKAVLGGALLNRIGAAGWSVYIMKGGLRLKMDLEDFGRFGLLMVNEGRWGTTPITPSQFVEDLSTVQVTGIPANFNNANNGDIELRNEDFPLGSPYGYFTWANTNQDAFPLASPDWAWAQGALGNILLWNKDSGIVMGILASHLKFSPPDTRPGWPIQANPVVETIEANIAGNNPLVSCQ